MEAFIGMRIEKMTGILKLICTEKSISTVANHEVSTSAISWPKLPLNKLRLHVCILWCDCCSAAILGTTRLFWFLHLIHSANIVIMAVTSVGPSEPEEAHSYYIEQSCFVLWSDWSLFLKRSCMGSILDTPEIKIIQQMAAESTTINFDSS